jgi:hypothetical protein
MRFFTPTSSRLRNFGKTSFRSGTWFVQGRISESHRNWQLVSSSVKMQMKASARKSRAGQISAHGPANGGEPSGSRHGPGVSCLFSFQSWPGFRHTQSTGLSKAILTAQPLYETKSQVRTRVSRDSAGYSDSTKNTFFKKRRSAHMRHCAKDHRSLMFGDLCLSTMRIVDRRSYSL